MPPQGLKNKDIFIINKFNFRFHIIQCVAPTIVIKIFITFSINLLVTFLILVFEYYMINFFLNKYNKSKM